VSGKRNLVYKTIMKKTKPILFINQDLAQGTKAIVCFPGGGVMRTKKTNINISTGKLTELHLTVIDFNIVIIEGRFTSEEFHDEVSKRMERIKT
jgi:hypothetical protein